MEKIEGDDSQMGLIGLAAVELATAELVAVELAATEPATELVVVELESDELVIVADELVAAVEALEP